jgi:hypothetical protein
VASCILDERRDNGRRIHRSVLCAVDPADCPVAKARLRIRHLRRLEEPGSDPMRAQPLYALPSSMRAVVVGADDEATVLAEV